MDNQISKALLRKKFSDFKSPIKPDWIKVSIPSNKISQTKNTLKENKIVTVCEEAMCPNLSECWEKKHATVMILGDVCTRSCSFCNIKTGKPNKVDILEPARVASTVKSLGLKHVVVTSVDRDDLNDGGAQHFANTIKKIKEKSPNTTVEILTPDFRGKDSSMGIIAKTEIDVFNHNLETIKRLYKEVRPGADYRHSLKILREVKLLKPSIFTKSGIMIGLGEKFDEIRVLMDDLREQDVDFITIGQYLRPTLNHHPVIKYHNPDYFIRIQDEALNKGFKIVSSSPFTRSSYHAESDFNKLKNLHSGA